LLPQLILESRSRYRLCSPDIAYGGLFNRAQAFGMGFRLYICYATNVRRYELSLHENNEVGVSN